MKKMLLGFALVSGMMGLAGFSAQAGTAVVQSETYAVVKHSYQSRHYKVLLQGNVVYRTAPQEHTGFFRTVIYPWGPVVYYPTPTKYPKTLWSQSM